jgi:hypothetical protein
LKATLEATPPAAVRRALGRDVRLNRSTAFFFTSLSIFDVPVGGRPTTIQSEKTASDRFTPPIPSTLPKWRTSKAGRPGGTEKYCTYNSIYGYFYFWDVTFHRSNNFFLFFRNFSDTFQQRYWNWNETLAYISVKEGFL